MAFYTSTYINQLIREDHEAVQKHLRVKGNDFRSYIDSTIPFVLYLDIDIIRDRILTPNAKFITDLTKLLNLQDPSILINELDNTYKRIINEFINNKKLVHISVDELENILNSFELSIEVGGIKATLQKLFKNTMIITDLSKKDSRVVIVFPRFNTIRFGELFKKLFDYTVFSDIIDYALDNSPRNIVKAFLDKNFAVLQNIGHIEVEVTSADTKEIVRGLVSPRLAQALVELPNAVDPEPIVRKFSKETGQVDTRLQIKKAFSSQKLAMELLVKHGISIGTLESQLQNLDKAKRELAFPLGKDLTRKIIQSPKLLLNLVTSKSVIHFIGDSIFQMVSKGKETKYASKTTVGTKSVITRDVVKLGFRGKASAKKLPVIPIKTGFQSLANLEALLRSKLALQIKENMGTGSATNVLNYRTGRFAETASIERVLQSRTGMVSVFYDYMRYPYATFSTGGRQQNPRSRDPKLLISKSIREIGASAAYTRLRAVLV